MKLGIFILFGALFLVSCSSEKQQDAMIAANVLALETAESITHNLEEEMKCPERIGEWKVEAVGEVSEYSIHGGLDDLKFPLHAKCKKEHTFSISVKYSIDSGTWITGGLDKMTEISYGHFTDLKTLEVPKNANFHSIARRVVNAK